MKDEIKEILDKLKDKSNYQIDCNDGGAYKELFANEIYILLDYITNLQEENTKLKEELQQEKKDFKEANDYCFELKDYKSRNEKAMEYINHEIFKRTILVGVGTKKYTRNILDNVLNILQGEDKE